MNPSICLIAATSLPLMGDDQTIPSIQTQFKLSTLLMTSTLVLTVALLVGIGMNQINEAEKGLKK